MIEVRYLTKGAVAARYTRHPHSVPRAVKDGTFPSATIHLGPASPRWSSAELDRWDVLVAATGDTRLATSQVLAERASRLQAA